MRFVDSRKPRATSVGKSLMENVLWTVFGILLFSGFCNFVLISGRHRYARHGVASETGLRVRVLDAFDVFNSTSYFCGLDSLRAFSVIAVIWTHVTNQNATGLLSQGDKGVDLFFAISGFLVTTLLLREFNREGRISLRDFYVRRTLRIFPLYYAVLGLYCVLVFLTLRNTPKASEFWSNLPAFATFTSNWFVDLANGADHGVTFYFAWSLAVEEQFYLFWPMLMVFLLCKVKSYWLLLLAAVILIGAQILAANHGDVMFFAKAIGSLAPPILMGASFAVVLNRRAGFNALYSVLGNRFAAPAAGVLLLVLLQSEAQAILIQLVMATLVASVCMREDTFLHPILTWRPAVFVGTISYGVYLMHMLAANLVRKVLGHTMGIDVFIITTLLVIGVAWLSFKYFEAPLIRFGRRQR